jgi:DNA-3-methyladenine glycosylase I
VAVGRESSSDRRGAALCARACAATWFHTRAVESRASMRSERLRVGADGITRCAWCGEDPLYVAYHDREWGFPVREERRLYEKVCLEGFQSGLSWLTVLRKRARFREVFADFDFERVARFGRRDVARLLRDPLIIRHRGKIESTVNNARRARELVEEWGSLRAFFARFRRDRPFRGWRTRTAESEALSKELGSRGWTYVGPTTMHALMQAVGLVNDHAEGCEVRAAAELARRRERTSGLREGSKRA